MGDPAFFSEPVSLGFLNVVIDRLPRAESVVNGRSHCTNCGRVLHAWELIPCVSYIFLRGRCAGCKSRIPGRDFFVEVIGGAAFIGCGIRYGCGSLGLLSMRGTVMLIYFGILLVVALIDWDTQIIYDRFHIFILILAIANIWLVPEHGLIDRLIGALIISVPSCFWHLRSREHLAWDIKLMAVSGAVSWDRTGSVRHVFRAADRRRLWSIYAKEQEIRKKRCICIRTISCIRTGAGGIIWKSDRYMVSAFFIKRVTNSYKRDKNQV